jgi:hypothetical protein
MSFWSDVGWVVTQPDRCWVTTQPNSGPYGTEELGTKQVSMRGGSTCYAS